MSSTISVVLSSSSSLLIVCSYHSFSLLFSISSSVRHSINCFPFLVVSGLVCSIRMLSMSSVYVHMSFKRINFMSWFATLSLSLSPFFYRLNPHLQFEKWAIRSNLSYAQCVCLCVSRLLPPENFRVLVLLLIVWKVEGAEDKFMNGCIGHTQIEFYEPLVMSKSFYRLNRDKVLPMF